MIIPLINQAKLCSISDAEELKRITDILDKNKIEYYMKTQRNGANTVSRIMNTKDITASTGYGVSVSQPESYVYTVYVKRKELENAKGII